MATGRAKKRVKRTPATPGDLFLAAQLDTASNYSNPSLVSVDHSLRCAICTELLTAPVILSTCSHSFDSYCLRTYLVTHKRCPSCLRECSEANIHLNLALQAVVAAWKDARPTLLRLQSLAASAAPTAGPSPPPPAAPPPAATPSAASKRQASDVEIIEDGSTARASASRRPPPKKKIKGADGRETRAGEGKGKGRAKDLEDADPTDPSLILECPLCGGSIKNALMALHVERCNGVAPPPPTQSTAAWGKLLGTGGRAGAKDDDSDLSQSDTRGSSKLDTTRHLPLASYAHKSVPELNEMLKAYGLPTTLPSSSSRDPLTTEAKLAFLTRRHRQFLVLWNANADLAADDPAHLNAQGVRDELKKWEKTRDRQSGAGGAAAGGGTAGAAGSGVGPSGEWSTKAHLRKYKDDFRELVAQARASYEAGKQLQRAKVDNEEPPEQDQQDEQAQEPVTAPPAAAEPAPAAEEPAVARTAAAGPANGADPGAGAGAGRKRTVRILSPPPRSSPPPAPSPHSLSSSSSSPPPLPDPLLRDSPPPLRASPSPAGSAARSPSPFDAERPPRASQRNREEERMFAEMLAAREEAEARAGEGLAGGSSDGEGA